MHWGHFLFLFLLLNHFRGTPQLYARWDELGGDHAQVSKIIITMILTFAATAETLVEFCMKMLCVITVVIVYTAAVVADDWMIAWLTDWLIRYCKSAASLRPTCCWTICDSKLTSVISAQCSLMPNNSSFSRSVVTDTIQSSSVSIVC